MEKLFAVGDIHGCYPKLLKLMERLAGDPERDLLIFVGDYIDRGDQSREVVEYLLRIQQTWKRTVFLLGNHERMLLDYLDGGSIQPFLVNGGKKTLDSYFGERREVTAEDPRTVFPPDHLAFFRSLLPYYEHGEYLFVHAGLREGIPLEEQNPFDLLWIREDFYFSPYDFGRPIVFGHTPFQKAFVYKNRIGIDTGAVYGNLLTAVELPEMKFISV
jgi:serine/threonine protein phosphatase 1